MLRAPLLPTTAKLDINLLLGSSPSPPPSATQPPSSRSISAPISSSQLPIVSSPSTSTASQFSTSTAPPSVYQAGTQHHQQQQIYGQRRLGPPEPAPTINKRPPPTNTHPSASPAKKHNSKWGPDEDALIIQLRGSGMKWEDISKRLPGRSTIACRLHYQNYLERRTPWDEEKKDKLARLYDRMKNEMWQKVADELQVPWRAAEAMHWALGESEMARRAGVVPFSMALQNAATTTSSTCTSTSGLDPVAYAEGVGRIFEIEEGDEDDYAEEEDRGTREGKGLVLPSLAELEHGVPAYAGFVGEIRREQRGDSGKGKASSEGEREEAREGAKSGKER